MAKTALVFRPTGSQGKAVVKHLASSGWNVRAFIPDPLSERALALKYLGNNISLFKGTLDDLTAMDTAMEGCDAIFLVQMPSWTDDSETRDAANIIRAAKAAGIEHIVVSTLLGIDRANIADIFSHPIIAPVVDGKVKVEKLVRESGLQWTFLHPGWFNTNVTLPVVNIQYPGLSQGKLVCSYQPQWAVGTVDPDDIGAFAAMVFNDPRKFSGSIIDVLSEIVTVEDIFKEIERATGKKIEVHYRTAEENQTAFDNPYAIGQSLMKDLEPFLDIEKARSYGIPLTTFRQFLKKNKESVVPK